ncbi:beta-galactosidase, partial [bacterium]
MPPELPAPTSEGWSATPLKVPSPWNVNRWTVQGRGDPNQPYRTDSVYYPSYPRAWDGAEMGWLRRTFRVPPGWNAKRLRLRLRFEAVAGDAEVWVNGRRIGRHFDSFLPFEFDVTDAVRRYGGKDGVNEVRVGVRAAWLYDHRGVRRAAFRSPYPPGSTLDHIVGIWQDVSLLGVPAVRVSDAFVQPYVGRDRLEIAATVANDGDRPQTVAVGGDVRPWTNLAGKNVLATPEPRSRLGAPTLAVPPRTVTIPAHASRTVTLATRPAGCLKRWSPAAPNLYGAVLDVRIAGRTADRKFTRFGWREFTIRGRDLLLNGESIRLYGDLLHPFGPFVGSRRYFWSWYRMIQDMGGNAVRLHGQPHPRAALDLADEMGICVLDETALFGSSLRIDFDAPEAWPRFEAHYDGLVRRDRNHPSVFGWSPGNELFAMFLDVPEAERAPYYARLGAYTRRALRLDPTRAWISCDGDETLRGAAPVWSRHYGLGVPKLPEVPGPSMVGESGGSYYAKPSELAAVAGERA